MPLHSQPASLESQCIRKIGTLVSQTFSRLLQPENAKRRRHVKSTCKLLKQIIHYNIPHVLANPVTTHLLRVLDDTQAYKPYLLTSSFFKKLVQLFIHAILSPEITVLEITWQWKFVGNFVPLELRHLSNLKVLSLCESDYFDGERSSFEVSGCMKQFAHLENLTVQSKCTNEIISAVSRCCKKLKLLDISGSFSVTDASVEDIVKLDLLQSIDVTHTGLTDAGRTRLLSGLSQHSPQCLKSYACNHICNSEIDVLVNNFPKLNSLSVRFINININLEIFQRFNDLQIFKTDNYLHNFHRDLTQFVGRNLVELQLVGYELNVSHLVEGCPLLTRLTLKMDCIHPENEILTFYKLKHLTLVTNNSVGTAFLLTCCPNLVSLQLMTIPAFYNQFYLEMAVLKNPLKYLKELSIGSISNDLPPATLWFIAIHWDLVSCKVMLQNSKRRDQYKGFPGIQVDCDLWMKINERVHFTDIRRKPKKQNQQKGTRDRLYTYAKT